MKQPIQVSILLAICGTLFACASVAPTSTAIAPISQQPYPVAPPPPQIVAAPAKPAIPTSNQIEFQDLELGMMIHFGPLTYSGQEKDDAITVPLSSIDPKALDTDQWVDVAVSMGAKYIVFVAKNPGGFCSWRTKMSAYNIGKAMWKDGALDTTGDKPGMGDLLMYLHDSCKKRGLRLGVLFSSDDPTLHVNAKGEADSEWRKQLYEDAYRRQLGDLTKRYKPLLGVWFDGFAKPDCTDMLSAALPGAIISRNHGQNIRWSGTTDGTVPYPTWNSVTLKQADAEASLADSDPDGGVWMPVEARISLRSSWYASDNTKGSIKSVPQLVEAYEKSVGRGANLLVNVSPDTTGLIPHADAKRAAEFGREIQRRYGKALGSNPGGPNIVVALASESRVGHVVMQEDLISGEKVREYVVEAWIGEEWKQVASGTAIGRKRIEKFAPVPTTKIRVRITKAVEGAKLRSVAVFAASR